MSFFYFYGGLRNLCGVVVVALAGASELSPTSRGQRGKKNSPTWNGRAPSVEKEVITVWKAFLRVLLKQIKDMLRQGVDAETILAKVIEAIEEMLK